MAKKSAAKVGRPPISEGLKENEKTPIHNIRVGDAEWDRWGEAAAIADEHGNLSAWIRGIVGRAADRVLGKRSK